MKKRTVFTIILVLLAVSSVILAVFAKKKLTQQQENPQISIGDVSTRESAKQDVFCEFKHENPLMKSDIENVLYSFDDNGKVTFYQFAKNELKEMTKGIKTVDISVSMSDDEINTTVYYFETDKQLCGYGVFTSSMDKNVKVYSFVIFHLTRLSNGDTVLLVNSDKDSAYNNVRVWDDMFEINLENGNTERYFSERNRSVDMSGARRRDFFVTTENSVNDFGDDVLFFSSRDYQVTEDGSSPIDIYKKSGSAEEKVAMMTIDYFVAPGKPDPNSESEDGGLLYLRTTGNGFSLYHDFGNEELGGNSLLTLDGDYNTAYMRSGNYLLDKENGVVYSLLDGRSRTLGEYSINAMTFSVSEDGNTVLLTGTVTNALEYGIYTYNFETKKASLYIKEEFSSLFNPMFVNNNAIAYTYPDGDKYKTVITAP